jgi:hypothetical protein
VLGRPTAAAGGLEFTATFHREGGHWVADLSGTKSTAEPSSATLQI